MIPGLWEHEMRNNPCGIFGPQQHILELIKLYEMKRGDNL